MASEFQGLAGAGEDRGREDLPDARINRTRKPQEAMAIHPIFFQRAMEIETYHIGPDLSDAIVGQGVGFRVRAAKHAVV